MLRGRAGRSGHGAHRRAGHRFGVDTCVPCQPRDRCGAHDNHYEAVSRQYHTAFFYTGEYERWQLCNILSRLQLRPSHRLVDIGGGTGRFASLLHAAAGLENAVLCVDPSRTMLEEAATLPGVDTACQGGLEFAQMASMAGRYDRALIKEVVHHLDDEDLAAMYTGIFAQLPPGGRVLTCTRPQYPAYPFFRGALEVWSRQQKPMEHYVQLLRAAGFAEVRSDVAEFPATLNTDWWLEMVHVRFWSTFSREYFSDEQLAAGIEEIRAEHAGRDTISFTERMVFITACKPGHPEA